jgi:hypothetical protein
MGKASLANATSSRQSPGFAEFYGVRVGRGKPSPIDRL